MRKHREDDEARALIQWADLHPVIRGRLVHIPNGGKRSRTTAAIFKALGVRAGYPDYVLDMARGGYHGMRIELKASRPHDSRVTALQTWWLEDLAREGYACMVARGWIEAKAGIEMYLRAAFPPLLLQGDRPIHTNFVKR
jgi:hypothetical protein